MLFYINMGKNEKGKTSSCSDVDAVLSILRKHIPLTLKQEKFCNTARVKRFLKTEGDNVKKAAKKLRACLSWRDHFGTDNIIADEFSAELAEGLAYVAGQDEDSRPVLIIRINQDYLKRHSQKSFTRLLVFTVEVALGTMPKNVDQFTILLDASLYRSASSFMNLLLPLLKIVGDYYPGQLYKAFVVDPPSLFAYLWKAVRKFVEQSTATMLVHSSDFKDSFKFDDFSTYPRTLSLRLGNSSMDRMAKISSCRSSRFSFTVSHHFDSVKPWYLSLVDTSDFKEGPTLGPAMISPVNTRSHSSASLDEKSPRGRIRSRLFPSTPLPQRTTSSEIPKVSAPWTPLPSYLQSSKRLVVKPDISNKAFQPYLKFYRRPYDEIVYRSNMRPPLGGLISIVGHRFRHHNVSASELF